MAGRPADAGLAGRPDQAGILGNIAGIGLVTAGMNAGLIVIAVSWLAEIFPAFHLHMKRGLREAAEYRKTRRIEANTGMD